jgi:CRISPR system Cascade subunit CasC
MTGSRTKRAVEMIAASIAEQTPELADRSEELAIGALTAAGIAVKEDKGVQTTGYLLFISQLQADKLAELATAAAANDEKPNARECKAALQRNNAVDMALFGRMVAEDPSLNIDAACQVAHAIGIHRSDNEFDYYTAMDDRSPEDTAGAGMIGTIEFTSSTLYRYATINVPLLEDNLGSTEATVRAVQAFVAAFIVSMPTGKQNTFANRTLPGAVVVQVRTSQPVSLVNAFEKPVEPRKDKSRMQVACEALAAQERRLDVAFGVAPLHSYAIQAACDTEALADIGVVMSLSEVIAALADDVRACLAPKDTVDLVAGS